MDNDKIKREIERIMQDNEVKAYVVSFLGDDEGRVKIETNMCKDHAAQFLMMTGQQLIDQRLDELKEQVKGLKEFVEDD